MKLSFVLIFLIAVSCTQVRILAWNFASQKDMKRFPSNEIGKSSSPFEFARNAEQQQLRVDRPSKNGYVSKSVDEFLEDFKPHQAFIVIKNDTIIYDHYGEGIDENSMLTYFSVLKSILSVLIGIALEEGAIRSIDEPIINYLPELTDENGFDQITIKHVLKHTSGIRFRESYVNPFANDVAGIYYSKSFDNVLRKLKIENPPDQAFRYSSINTQLLGLVLIRSTGLSISEYMEDKLWGPIGAKNSASWSTYEKDGIEKAFCCINASAIDMAKFGRLAMNKGSWNGQPLVSEEWFNQSTIQSTEGGSIWIYQLHWVIGLKEYEDFMAQGLYDQFVYVMPKKNVIIVSVNDFHNPKTGWKEIFHQIVDQI